MRKTTLLYWVIGSYLIVNFSFASKDVGEFSVEGKIQLPATGNYQQIPKGTCIHMSVVDGIQCEYCKLVKRGYLVLRNFTVLKNEIPFKIPCRGGNGIYYVSAILFYGWCSDGNQSLKKGDYHNDFQVEIHAKKDKDVSINIPLTYYVKESFAPKQADLIYGTMYFPKEGIYTNIPKGSCLRVTVKPNIAIMCIKAPCVIRAVATYTIHDKDIKFVGKTIRYKIPAKLKQDFYVVRAILNLGWCSMYDEDYPREKWLSDNDYYSGSQSTFIVGKNEEITSHNIDLTMTNTHGKYLCGERSCYKTEICVKGTYDYDCECSIPVITIFCKSLHRQPFCGTDGKTYNNRCFSNRADCFSNTIQVAHSGECKRAAKFGGDDESDDDKRYSASQMKSIQFSVGFGLLGLIILILVMAGFWIKSRKRSQRRNSNTSVGFEPQSPAKRHVNIPHANINKGCAYITKNEVDVEVKGRAVYMEDPPSYASYTLQDSPPSYESLPPKV